MDHLEDLPKQKLLRRSWRGSPRPVKFPLYSLMKEGMEPNMTT
jgi:hypothetical protein